MKPARTKRLPAVLLTTRETIEGRKIKKELGIVVGSSVKAKHIGHNFYSRMKGIVGGEMNSYTDLLNQTSLEATTRAMREAEKIGATALVRLRYQTAVNMEPTTGSFTTILCYGTAVKCDPIKRIAKESVPKMLGTEKPNVK
eukprot:gb/GECH01002618.1/.p1 GENE.gb/GECH01002618.1/~~gb/GECH01002618.1/.p1  ORF type:complete len:142 (+),score=30.76 gb/GECH01002618.1/:1-426(+)